MIIHMKFLTHRWVRKHWTATPVNQNTPDGHIGIYREYQQLMDRIDPHSRQGIQDCAALARALVGRARAAKSIDEVELCLQAFILLVALQAEGKGRSLLTVRELLADPDTFLGSLIMMTATKEAVPSPIRLFGKRLRLWTEEKRLAVAAAARRHLAFLPKLNVAGDGKPRLLPRRGDTSRSCRNPKLHSLHPLTGRRPGRHRSASRRSDSAVTAFRW